MTDRIKDAIFKAIDEVFQPREFMIAADIIKQPDFTFRDLNDSSIKFVEFCMHLEESLGIEIEFSDLLDHPTYSGFSNWLHQQGDQG